MKFAISLKCDPASSAKMPQIVELSQRINTFLYDKNYGPGLLDYLVMLDIANYPERFGHLRKYSKPKFTKIKVLKNRHTGERMELRNHFSYSLHFEGEEYERFTRSSDDESEKMLILKILSSLSNLDALPPTVKDFDKETFKLDVARFLGNKQ